VPSRSASPTTKPPVAVHPQRFPQSRAWTIEEVFARLALPVDAGNLDDSTDPERPVLLYDRREPLTHTGIMHDTVGDIGTARRLAVIAGAVQRTILT
jgi:hypothetical protein